MGKPVSFEEAFPKIEEINIEGTEGDLGSGLSSGGKISLNKKNFGKINCSNSLCNKGGYEFEIGNLISEMQNKRETSREKTISCKGYENMGGRQTRRCMNGLSIKITIKYK